MKAVLNIVAAVLVAAGLVVTVASLLTPGQVILGIDFKLAAILVVGGLMLHALASALLLLQRMSHDLRLLRKAGSEEPPWLRQAARSGIEAAAAAAPAYAAAEEAESVREDDSAEPPEEVGQDIGEQLPESTMSDETEWSVVSEAQWPDVPEPQGPAEDEAEPEAEPQAMEPAEPEEASEPEPMEPVAEAAPEEAIEPEPDKPRAEAPSRLKPSREAGRDNEPPAEPEPAPSEAPHFEEEVEEHAELYVVEERQFRGKQARVLSDGTIEAETAEGWMRFEDFDHLEEYLEAMAEPGR